MDRAWAEALAPVASDIAALGERLRTEVAEGRGYLPAGDRVLRAFQRPLADVSVLIVGQDPYPTPGHPIGLSFAVDREVRPLPRSLANIYKELESDLGISPSTPRRPVGVERSGRHAAQPSAHRRTGSARLAPRLGVGAGHRTRDPHSRRSRPADGGDPVGARRRRPQAAARFDADHRIRAPLAAVCESRILRVPSVLESERTSARTRRCRPSTGASRIRLAECSRRNTTRTVAGCPCTCAVAPSRSGISHTRSARPAARTCLTCARSTTITSRTRWSHSMRSAGRTRSGTRSSTTSTS